MTCLSAAQSASIRLVGQRPSTIFSSTDTYEMEVADLLNEVAADIAASADWQALIRIGVLVGDGVTEAFDAPDDYNRMPINADLVDSTGFAWGYTRAANPNQFLGLNGITGFPGFWAIYGGQFQLRPAPAAGAEIEFIYITSHYATDTNGTPKATFTNDNDIFRLPERLLTLGLVWRWRSNKKLDWGEDQAAFSKAFAEMSGRDRGSRIHVTGPSRWSGDIGIAYPFRLGP